MQLSLGMIFHRKHYNHQDSRVPTPTVVEKKAFMAYIFGTLPHLKIEVDDHENEGVTCSKSQSPIDEFSFSSFCRMSLKLMIWVPFVSIFLQNPKDLKKKKEISITYAWNKISNIRNYFFLIILILLHQQILKEFASSHS